MATIKRFVIHELFKDKVPDKAETLLELENKIILNLCENLLKTKDKRTAVLWGKFKGTGDFPAELKRLNADLTVDERDTILLNLTYSVMDSLYEEIVHTNSNGGYICFIEYTSHGNTRILAAMINNTAGVKLTKLKPTKEIHVDLSKLHQAVDINASSYFTSLVEGYKNNYLSFIGKGKSSDYFTQAFDCIDTVTPAKAVAKAPIVLKDFLEQFNVDKATQKSARAQLVKYLSDNISDEVHLSKIDEIAVAHMPIDCSDEEKQSFIEFSKQETYQMPASFEARKGAVEKLAKIYYATDFFNLNFDIENIGIVGRPEDADKPLLFDIESEDVIIKGRMITPAAKAAIYQANLLNNEPEQ